MVVGAIGAACGGSRGQLRLRPQVRDSDGQIYWTGNQSTSYGYVFRVHKISGQPTSWQTAPGATTGVALDAQHAYWLREADGGSFFRAPRSGLTGKKMKLTSGFGPAYALALDGNGAFFAGDEVYRYTLADLNATQLADGEESRAIAVDAKYVYWSTPSAIRRVLRGGGSDEIVAEVGAMSYGIAVDNDYVYFTVIGAAGSLMRVKK